MQEWRSNASRAQDRQEVIELGLCEYETGDFVKLYIMGFTGENEEGVPIHGFDWIRVKN